MLKGILQSIVFCVLTRKMHRHLNCHFHYKYTTVKLDLVCLFTIKTLFMEHATPFYPQKLALTSPTSSGRSIGIVCSRTKSTELDGTQFTSTLFCIQVTMNEYNNPSFATMFQHALLNMFQLKSKPSSGVIVYRILNASCH
jgi:hypothetical protein